MLFHQLGAMYLSVGILSAVLPRYSADVNVWKILQDAILVVDCILLGSLYLTLEQQGRLEVAAWRFEDWMSLILTSFVALLRSSFLAGIGLKTVEIGKKRACPDSSNCFRGKDLNPLSNILITVTVPARHDIDAASTSPIELNQEGVLSLLITLKYHIPSNNSDLHNVSSISNY